MEYGTEFFSALLDHLDIGVFVLDTNGTYVYGNHAYYELVCKPREFFSGVSISALKQQGYLTHSVWEQVMQQGKPVYSVVTITDRLLNRSYNTLTGGFPFYDDEGVLRFVFCTQEKLTHLSRRLQQGMISITGAEATGDLRYCKVYLSVLGLQSEKEFMKGLKSASGWLRRSLGESLNLRYTPELVFELDRSIENGAHINSILSTLAKPEDETIDD